MSGLSFGAILLFVGSLITYLFVPKQLVPFFALIAAIGMVAGYFIGNVIQRRTNWMWRLIACLLAAVCCFVFGTAYEARINMLSANTIDIVWDALLFMAFFLSFAILAAVVRLNLKVSDATMRRVQSMLGMKENGSG